MKKIASLFKSRRFYTAISGVLVVLFSESLGLTEDQVLPLVGVLMTWIVGDSLNKTGGPKVGAPDTT